MQADKKCIVLSLIRHGQVCLNPISIPPSVLNPTQSINQATLNDWPPDGDLSELGKSQAKELGEEWKDVRIDNLYSSTLKRAYNTALAISTQNKAQPRVIQDEIFVERKIGDNTYELAREGDTEALRQCV
jgi:broad specificity phosphatase PhoE